MHWASALAEGPLTASAFDDAAQFLKTQLDGRAPSVVLAFLSAHYRKGAEAIAGALQRAFPGAVVAGATGSGVVGNEQEVDDRPGIALFAGVLPGIDVRAFRLGEEDGDVSAIERAVGHAGDTSKCLVILADPWTCDAQVLLPALDDVFPHAVKVGALAHGPTKGSTMLFANGEVQTSGVVGLSFAGPLAVDTIIAQACRPVGEPMIVTRSRGHIVYELGKRPPAEVLNDLFDAASERDRDLLRSALHVGLERKGAGVHAQTGEFLARNVVGLDPRTGALAVDTAVSDWDVLQFLVRDATTAQTHLLTRLQAYAASAPKTPPTGALMFSSPTRGKSLFGTPNHDLALFRETVARVPVGGMFGAGEMGPLGEGTYLHGVTSVFAIFREAP
jgi:small ligand-binding sensory domain FIST